MKLAFENLGCPKNQVDLEIILGGLSDEVTLVDTADDADAVIINTCSFIESSKRESIDTIFEAVAARERKPDLKIFVSGCLPQRYRDELEELIPEVDRFFFSRNANETLDQLRQELKSAAPKLRHRHLLNPAHYAYVRISEGCNNRCAYCAIPLIKGNHSSRPMDEIIRESEQLISQGAKELIVIAQDTTFYGSDLSDGASLPVLLERLNQLDGLEWLRLMYTHPAHWRDDLLKTVAALDKLVPYFDVPIQHISDPVLKRMGRRVNRRQIEELIDTIRRTIPGVALRTSIITGFPGESEEDFRELYAFLEHTRFERLGVFTYSPEEGTRAHDFPDQVEEEVKLERQQAIMALQESIAEEVNGARVGETMQVIVDEVDFNKQVAFARSKWDAPEVDGNIFLPENVLVGELYNVRIVKADAYDLTAELLD